MNIPRKVFSFSASRSRVSPLGALLFGAGAFVAGSISHLAAQTVLAGESQTPQAALDAAAQAAGSPAPQTSDRHLAPRDTFFLLTYASAKTPQGVIGFEPGRKVRLIEVHPATQTLVVGDDEAQVEVGPEKLTNDLDVAAAARLKDETHQATVAAYIKAEQDAHNKFVREAAEATAKDIADRKEDEKQRVAEAREAREDALASRNAAASPYASNAGNGGYYDDGGYGYGSPYAYFVNNAASGTPNSAPAKAAPAAAAKSAPGNVAAPAQPAAPPAGRPK